MKIKYFNKDGYKSDEENATMKLVQKEGIVEMFRRVKGNWIFQWRVKGYPIEDVRIFAGDAKKVQREAIEREEKARKEVKDG